MAGQNLPPPFFERGDTIGRILVIEFNDQDSSVFDEVMAVLKHHSAFEQLRFNEEDVLSLPGLEIYPDRRKIYRNRREINLTAKEFRKSRHFSPSQRLLMSLALMQMLPNGAMMTF